MAGGAVPRRPDAARSARQEASGEAGTLLIGNTPGLVQALDPDPVDYNEITAANVTRLTALAGIVEITMKQQEVEEDGGHTGADRPVPRTV